PLDLAADDAVDEMTELVEVGHDLGMLHERGTLLRVRVREVAHEHPVRLGASLEARHEREAGGVLELALARMHVERDEAHLPPIDPHREGLDRGMPQLALHRDEFEAEELAVEVEDRLPHRAVLEVR